MIFLKLVSHSWKMFRRSELFNKSAMVILLLAIWIMVVLWQLNLAARLLPELLNEHFPARTPGAWVYGFLLPIMLFDFFGRIIMQSLPAKHIKPYLHLPLSGSTLSAYWMLRSWLHPLNFYLLFFFLPFIRLTINPETSSQQLGLLGIFLLSAINQGFLMWLKSESGNRTKIILPAGIAATALILAYSWFPDAMMQFSLSMFLRFTQGDITVFAITIGLVLVFHYLSFMKSKTGFYSVFEQTGEEKIAQGSNRWERFLASVPGLGRYWLLEWRLVSRNNRSKYNFFFMIPMAVAFSIFIALNASDSPEAYIIVIFMIAGSYGNFHLQHAFSWESHFFDFLTTRHVNIVDFIMAKYLFYLAYSSLQLLIILPVILILSPNLIVLFIAMFLYGCGFGFYFYLRTGIGNSTRFDANGKSTFNLEGVTGLKFLQVMLLFLSILPFIFLGILIPGNNGPSILLAATGLIFILTQKWWIRSLANKLERRKYINLNLYRQK